MDRVSHEAIAELLGAYAVHALDDDELATVEAHLETCAECCDEVDRLLDASASLGLMASEAPSGALWDRIAAEVSSIAPAASADGEPAGPAPHTVPGVAPLIALDAAREARRERRVRWRIAIVSAAAAVALTAPITAMLRRPADPSLSTLAQRATAEAGAHRITLVSADGVDMADAVITESGLGYLYHDAMPALPAGSTYQLWAMSNGKPVSAGLLGNDPGASAFTVHADIEALAISIEPAAGSAAPSADPVAVGTLS